MKITKLETLLTNAGVRNYLFVRLTTDTGLTGIGEASLEWQEKAVESLLYEWVEERILGVNPFDVETLSANLIRDQYQGGPTVLSAISGVEIACWDLIGKAQGQPVHQLLGGKARDRLPAYANGWYGGARTPQDYAALAHGVVQRGYSAMKFDPFGVAWQSMTPDEMEAARQIVAAVREAVGERVELMIEVHGRLNAPTAIEMGEMLERYRPAWYEEPVVPNDLNGCAAVKRALPFPIATGERLYTLPEFDDLLDDEACDIVQPDLAHCGGLSVGKHIARLAQMYGVRLAPHCSIGPVALCAAIHFGWATPSVMIQENFGDFDVPWRRELVKGWHPPAGEFSLPDRPDLGIELDDAVCARHPYKRSSFPSLWDDRWLKEFTKSR